MRFKKKILMRVALVLLIMGAGIWFLFRIHFWGKLDFTKFNFTYIEGYINSYGSFAAVIFILIFTLRTLLVFFPFSIMVILGGSVFGHVSGFLYSMISIFTTASLAFFIARFAGKDVVRKLLRGRGRRFNLKIGKHGFKIILFMRMSSLFPYDILNYAAGLSKLKYKDFISGTMLGIIPETFSLTYLGSNLNNPFSWKFVLAIGMVVLTFAIPFLYKRLQARRKLTKEW